MKKQDRLKRIEEGISYTFLNKDLLEEAFVHRSALNEKGRRLVRSNERLEFLGDSILSSSVSHLLMNTFTEMDEGGLSKLRARMVSAKTLSLLARDLSLGDYLLLARGEALHGGGKRTSILADTFEALIAAIYLDGGYQKAFGFIESLFTKMLSYLSEAVPIDYKTTLQEYTQKACRTIPVYTLATISGPEHDRIFHVQVAVDGKVSGTGSGSNKKSAEQEAAREALERLHDKT